MFRTRNARLEIYSHPHAAACKRNLRWKIDALPDPTHPVESRISIEAAVRRHFVAESHQDPARRVRNAAPDETRMGRAVSTIRTDETRGRAANFGEAMASDLAMTGSIRDEATARAVGRSAGDSNPKSR